MSHNPNYQNYSEALEAALGKLDDLRLTLEDIRVVTPRDELVEAVRHFQGKLIVLRDHLEQSQASQLGSQLVRIAEELEERSEEGVFTIGELIDQATPLEIDNSYKWLAKAWEVSTVGDDLELMADHSWAAGSVGYQAAHVLAKNFNYVKEKTT